MPNHKQGIRREAIHPIVVPGRRIRDIVKRRDEPLDSFVDRDIRRVGRRVVRHIRLSLGLL